MTNDKKSDEVHGFYLLFLSKHRSTTITIEYFMILPSKWQWQLITGLRYSNQQEPLRAASCSLRLSLTCEMSHTSSCSVSLTFSLSHTHAETDRLCTKRFRSLNSSQVGRQESPTGVKSECE